MILAKQLVQLRKQETRSIAASSKINGIKTHTQVMASNVKLGEAMKTTTSVSFLLLFMRLIHEEIINSIELKTMAKMNKIQDPAKTAAIMREFEKQNMKMDMTDEMSKKLRNIFLYLY